MKIQVLTILLPSDAPDPSGSSEVRVLLDIDGDEVWFTFQVTPLNVPGASTHLISAGAVFLERFRQNRRVTHHVRRLVGQAVHEGRVHLPQLIAA